MQFGDDIHGIVKNGVLVLSGPVTIVKVEHGSLHIVDGLKGQAVERTYSRAHCPISRLITTQWSGYITFDAIRWLHDIRACFVHLDYNGTPLVTSAPHPAVMPAGLHRRQALLSADSALGKTILRVLIGQKIAGQIALLERLGAVEGAAEMRERGAELRKVRSLDDMLGIEGIASVVYWRSVADRTVSFGHRQHVPDYWRCFGSRRSILTGDPRNAVNPANAMLIILMGFWRARLQ